MLLASDEIMMVGNLNPESKFGHNIRQQNKVLHVGGVSIALTAEHARHEFKIMQIYEIRNE